MAAFRGRTTIALVAALAGLGGAILAGRALGAVDTASCCLQATSKLDGLLNPVTGGDEKFFTTGGKPANVLVILDTSGSMADWPQPWPNTTGCSHAQLTSLGYNKNTVYQPMWKNLNQSETNWFDKNKYYQAPSDGYGPANGNINDFNSSPSSPTYSTLANACSGAANNAQCQTCLQNQGYYIGNNGYRRVSGNFLNFYAPRDSGAVNVLTQIMHDVRNVRIGLHVFKKQNGSGCGYGTCMCSMEPMGPSCPKSSPLDASFVDNQRTNILSNLRNGLDWSGCGTPLSDALFFAGEALASDAPRGIPVTWVKPAVFNEPNANQASICFECGFSAIILLTDGEPNGDESFLAMPAEINAVAVPACPNPCTPSKLAKVAKWFWTNDIRADLPGVQKVATYTIGFSVDASNSNILKLAAQQGGGQFYAANSSSALKQAFTSIIDNIVSRNASFSSASIASLETGSAIESAVLPRMKPSQSLPWKGSLYRFRLYNEFVEETDLDGDAAGSTGYKTEIFLLDSNAQRVAEDVDGNFVLRGTTTPATPYWEASNMLQIKGYANRSIYTVTDSDTDGALTDGDAMLPFTTANAAVLQKYLGLVGTGLTYCPIVGATPSDGTLLAKWGMTNNAATCNIAGPPGLCLHAAMGAAYPATQAAADLLCTQALISYVRGMDLADEDADGIRNETRGTVLGDIFHSSPNVIEPPEEQFLCDLGISNQCVSTLYANTALSTPLRTYAEVDACTGAVNRTAYESYVAKWRRRDRLVIAGANDGMIHAFQNGRATETCPSGVPVVDYDSGTGDEVWAFIAPDQLPRLADGVLAHQYAIDGDVLVRDIWNDSALNPGFKDNTEYHTMVLAGEGRGGIHYFALEANFNPVTGAALAPTFRWMFPQPCSDESLNVGKTMLVVNPKPPPIGPVLLASSAAGAINRYGVLTEERWIAMLTGGWAPGLEKGRGIYALDMYSGKVNGRQDNLLWKAEFNPLAAGEQLTPLKFMNHSIVAPVAMVDYGQNKVMGTFGPDQFFDTAVVPDTGGQVWTVRMGAPGNVNAGTKLIDNWTAARSFEQDRDATAASSAGDGADPNTKVYKNRGPFFHEVAVGLQPDQQGMRVFLGTGNRYSILDTGAGVCRYDNPEACSRMGCTNVQNASTLSRLTRNITNEETHWNGQKFEHGRHTEAVAANTACGVAGGAPVVTASVATSTIDGCPGVPSYGNVRNRTAQCAQDAAANFSCQRTDANVNVLTDLPLAPSNAVMQSIGRNRFYGLWIYGGARTFDETAAAGLQTARIYDNTRTTDRTAARPTEGDLVDVTNTTCASKNNCAGAQATDLGMGWVIDYEDRTGWGQPFPDLEHKSAGGAGLLASCTLFATFFPNITANPGSCSAQALARSRIYQADFITGAPNCTSGFLTQTGYTRYQERDVVAPPPEMSTTIQISKSGKIRYSELLVESGQDQVTQADVSGVNDVLQTIYELPVSRELHACRHDGGTCVPSE